MKLLLPVADALQDFGRKVIVLNVVKPAFDNLAEKERFRAASARSQEIEALLGFR